MSIIVKVTEPTVKLSTGIDVLQPAQGADVIAFHALHVFVKGTDAAVYFVLCMPVGAP